MKTAQGPALYRVKEIFYSLQGEGFHAGRPAVFVRFSGCNLWSGGGKDRHGALCQFCDTDFLGQDGHLGGSYEAAELADAAFSMWPSLPTHPGGSLPFVVCTGGEPLLQLDGPLISALRSMGCYIAVETNGTIAAPPGTDWITVSPKAGAPLRQLSGDEIKLVFPQNGLEPSQFEGYRFDHFYLQPLDSGDSRDGTPGKDNCNGSVALAIEYCLAHPKWKLSVQLQKLIGLK